MPFLRGYVNALFYRTSYLNAHTSTRMRSLRLAIHLLLLLESSCTGLVGAMVILILRVMARSDEITSDCKSSNAKKVLGRLGV